MSVKYLHISWLKFDIDNPDLCFQSQAETPTSVEDGRLFRIDSDSIASYEDEVSLHAVFSSHKCPDCECTLSEYEEENINLCIVVLSTFVHRDPEMAASELIEMLCVVSRYEKDTFVLFTQLYQMND